MTSLTFLFYWQWCSQGQVVSVGALSSFVLCSVFNYSGEKITVSFIKREPMLKYFTLYATQEEVKQLQNQMFHGLVAV